MRKFVLASTNLMAACLLCLPAMAQQAQPQETQQQQQRLQQQRQAQPEPEKRLTEDELRTKVTQINRASDVVGMQVRNLQGERLGNIEDLVFDFDTGQIAYAVVNVGGFLGIGGRLVAVPLEALAAPRGEEHLLLNADRERLENAPGFDRNNWPDLDHPAWGAAAGFGRADAAQEQSYQGRIAEVNAQQRFLVVEGEKGSQRFVLDRQSRLLSTEGQQLQLQHLQPGMQVEVRFHPAGDDQMVIRSLHAQMDQAPGRAAPPQAQPQEGQQTTPPVQPETQNEPQP
jgi:sporulation protein YlmC with PRC-barrel domain